jgi:hypothetical protein
MTQFTKCPRCDGALYSGDDQDGRYIGCRICGWLQALEPTKQEILERKEQWDTNQLMQKALDIIARMIYRRGPHDNIKLRTAAKMGISVEYLESLLIAARHKHLEAQVLNTQPVPVKPPRRRPGPPALVGYILKADEMRALRGTVKKFRIKLLSGISCDIFASAEQNKKVTRKAAQRLADYYEVPLEPLIQEMVYFNRKGQNKEVV